LQASWSITGPGGLFNGRRTETAVTRQGLAFKRKERAQHQALSSIHELHGRIDHLEDQIEILSSRNASLQRNFDTILENYLDGKTTFINFKIALEEMTQTKEKMEQIKLMHTRDKLKLATIMGVEDFPGENFERLAKEMTDREAR
jgi:outer membrane protein TolC